MSVGLAPEASRLSGSVASGSSGEKRGAAAGAGRPAEISATATRRRAVGRIVMRSRSERGLRREDQAEPFVAVHELDAQRRGERAVETEPEAVVALERRLGQVAAVRGDAAGIVD